MGEGLLIIGFLRAPQLLSGARINRHDGGIVGREKQPILPQRNVSRWAAQHFGGGREHVLILPDQVTRGGINRLNLVVGVREKHHPVAHQRRGLITAPIHGH